LTRVIVWSPPYTHQSGGIRALYLLCDLLRERNIDANIQTFLGEYVENPYNAPKLLKNSDEDIHVYPEIIVNNPAGSDRFVRWLLNRADLDGECWAWIHGLGDHPILHVPIVESEIFKPMNLERKGIAYWVGKGYEDLYKIPYNAFRISPDKSYTREELAILLGSIEYLISFDPFSALNLEAAMCGTPVRVHTTAEWKPKDLENSFFGRFGIAYSDDEMEKAIWESKNGLAHMKYAQSKILMYGTVDNFANRLLLW